MIKAILPQCLLLPLFAWFVWGVDVWDGVSLNYPAYFVLGAITTGLLLLPLAFQRKRAVAVVPGVWLIFLLALPSVSNSSLKPLLRGVGDLEPGMDRAAVLETLNQRYAGTSYPEPIVYHDDETQLCLKPQGRDPGFSAECLMIYFEDGRFRRAEFLAD